MKVIGEGGPASDAQVIHLAHKINTDLEVNMIGISETRK